MAGFLVGRWVGGLGLVGLVGRLDTFYRTREVTCFFEKIVESSHGSNVLHCSVFHHGWN